MSGSNYNIPGNTVEERTKINLSENPVTRKTITSNHDSDDNSTDNEHMEQIVHKNTEENVKPIINNEMALHQNRVDLLQGPQEN